MLRRARPGVDADGGAARRAHGSSSPTRSASRFAPAAVRFTTALPKTRNAKVLRRAVRAVVTGEDAGGHVAPRGSVDPRRDQARRADGTFAHRRADSSRLAGVSCCGRSRPSDFDQWTEVRVRCRDWLRRWEPCSRRASADAARRPRAFAARCGARDRERQLGTGYGFGIFLLTTGPRSRARSTSASIQRGRSRTLRRLLDRRGAGRAGATSPRRVVLILRFAFEELGLHRLQVAIIPRNTPSRRVCREARPARRRHRRALPPDPRRLGGPRPLRDHRRGMGRARHELLDTWIR